MSVSDSDSMLMHTTVISKHVMGLQSSAGTGDGICGVTSSCLARGYNILLAWIIFDFTLLFSLTRNFPTL